MHPVVRIGYLLERVLAAVLAVFIGALTTYGACELLLALVPKNDAAFLGDLAEFYSPFPHIAAFLSTIVQWWSDVANAIAEIRNAVPEPRPPNPGCNCVEPPDLSPVWEKLAEIARGLGGWMMKVINWLALPVVIVVVLGIVDRVRPIALHGWYFDRWTLHDLFHDSMGWIGASIGVVIEIIAWVTFFYFMHALGSILWAPLSLLLGPYFSLWAAAFGLLAETLGSTKFVFIVVLVILAAMLLTLAVNVTSAVLRANDAPTAWRSAWEVTWPTLLQTNTPPMRLIARLINWAQEAILTWLVDPVHPHFPRQPEHVARLRANERREAISKFLDSGKLPVLRTEYRLAPGDQRKFREHAVINQIEEDGSPKLVNEFLEFPAGSPMVLKQPCLSGGFEEAVGQYVRLNYEIQPPAQRSLWQRLWAYERPEETIVPLLARVVDAAILADRHADALRRESDWPARPFYERIYAEYRPLPFPLKYLLRPLVGDGMPARVVIETRYEDVFYNALFGKGSLSSRYASWFGIGIQIQKPRVQERKRVPWATPQALCRRLKSHVAGVLSGRIDVTFLGASEGQTVQQSRLDSLHIMPSGPLADGCPSAVRPQPYPPPFDPGPSGHPPPKTDVRRVEIPLPPRGTVSNAPPVWLFPARDKLFADCQRNCLKLQSTGSKQTLRILHSALGEIVQRPSLLPRRYRGPRRKWLYRRTWSGAFYDPDLALWNRFPLFGCSYTLSEGWPRTDLRGAFATTMFVGNPFRWLRGYARRQHAERDWKPFGGVFVSERGSEYAGNLLLPEPLLYDYLNHLAQRDEVMKASRAGECKGPPFVPKPPEPEAR